MEALLNREEQFMVIEGGKKTYTIADIEALPSPGHIHALCSASRYSCFS